MADKWGGIEKLAMNLGLRQRAKYNGLRTGDWEPKPEAVAELRRKIEPLLQKAENLRDKYMLCYGGEQGPLSVVEFDKELDTWRK